MVRWFPVILLAPVACGRVGFDTRRDDAADAGDVADVADATVCTRSVLGPPTAYPVGAFVSSVVIGDVNGDGHPDVVAVQGNGFGVLLGRGDGTFGTAHLQSLPDGPCEQATGALALADLDRDGHIDLVVGPCDPEIYVLLGNGDGTFGAPSTFATSDEVHSVAIADLDGDGKLDVVETNYRGNMMVGVLLGNGNATFQPYVDYGAGAFPAGVRIADLDGNGIPDVVVANESDVGVSVLLGNGDGTLRPMMFVPTGTGPEDVAIADFNGDGKLDLAVADEADVSLAVALGNGDGSFQAAPSLPDTESLWDVVVVREPTPDLVVANQFPASITVFRANGDGSFQAGVDTPVGTSPNSLAVADLDGDGLPDLVVGDNGSNVYVLRSTCVATH